MHWRESHQVDYIFGLARNCRLKAMLAETRLLRELRYQTRDS